MSKKTATAIEVVYQSFDLSDGPKFDRVASLYRLDPAYRGDYIREAVRYVRVSSLSASFSSGDPETMIFAADSEGEVTSWVELPGSYRGGTDHAQALKGLGYEVVGES